MNRRGFMLASLCSALGSFFFSKAEAEEKEESPHSCYDVNKWKPSLVCDRQDCGTQSVAHVSIFLPGPVLVGDSRIVRNQDLISKKSLCRVHLDKVLDRFGSERVSIRWREGDDFVVYQKDGKVLRCA